MKVLGALDGLKGITNHSYHGSKSRSRPPTQRALRQIGLGDLDRSRAIRAKYYIESSKNCEKIVYDGITTMKQQVAHAAPLYRGQMYLCILFIFSVLSDMF